MDIKQTVTALSLLNSWFSENKLATTELADALGTAITLLNSIQVVGGYDPESFSPPPGKRVLVRVMYGTSGKPWTTVATFVPKHTEEADYDNYDGNLDYSEDTDTFYMPEGWYEHEIYTERRYLIHDAVIAWMYLPDDVVIDEQARINAEKAAKWDALEEKIAAFYDEDALEDGMDEDVPEDGLIGIGEVAAHAFGYL